MINAGYLPDTPRDEPAEIESAEHTTAREAAENARHWLLKYRLKAQIAGDAPRPRGKRVKPWREEVREMIREELESLTCAVKGDTPRQALIWEIEDVANRVYGQRSRPSLWQRIVRYCTTYEVP